MKYLTQYLISCLIFIFIGCSGFEFVYQNSPIINKIKENAIYEISGDNRETLTSQFHNYLGHPNYIGDYVIKINSELTETPIVIEQDASASKIEIVHNIRYELKQKNSGCIIFLKEITSRAAYNQRSSGYNFTSDFSKEETIINNLDTNLNLFLRSLRSELNELKCVDED